MVNYTQTVCPQFADKLIVFEHFAGLALKGLKNTGKIKVCSKARAYGQRKWEYILCRSTEML